MSKNRALIIAILIVAVAVTTAVAWKVRGPAVAAKHSSEAVVSLSAEEIVLMLQHQTLVEPSRVYAIVETAETRKIFINGLRDYLSLAAKARREGLADAANIKLSLEYKRNYLLANLYQNKLDNQFKRFYEVPRNQIEGLWRNPEIEKQFQAEVKALRSIQQSVAENSENPHAAPELQGEAFERTRNQWARTKILSDMAKGDAEFIDQQAVQLRLRVADAGVLAFNYLNKYWADKVIPTNEEIAAYLAAHPEYDIKRKLEKAKTLLRRVKAGEDFAKLAEEFSEDRFTKSKGGLYVDLVKGYLWPEVESAALKLRKGQVAEALIETQHGYHIVQLVDYKPTKDESSEPAKFSIRHIMLRKTFEEPGIRRNSDAPPAFLEPREIAWIIITNEKRRRFIDEVVMNEKISLPDDFAFAVTAELKASAVTAAQQARKLINKDAASGNKGKRNQEAVDRK